MCRSLGVCGLLGTLVFEVSAQRHGPVSFPAHGMRSRGGVAISAGSGGLRIGPGTFPPPALGVPDVSLPAVSPIPPLGPSGAQIVPRRTFGPQRGIRFLPLSGFFWPWAQEVVVPYGFLTPSTVVIVQQVRPGPLQPPRVEQARSVIHEYKPPEPRPPEEKEAAFVIALTDGPVESALAVWVQAGSLHWIDASHRGRSATLERIDRDRTLRLNRERGLRLPLPGW